MKTLLKIITLLLLLVNGTGAIYGGTHLILHPDGSSLGMSLEFLNHTPFQNYLIPGITLFIANGICSFMVILSLILNRRNYPLFVIAQGMILTGWIIIQVFLIQTIHLLHIFLGSIGMLLIILGWVQKRLNYVSR